MTVEYSTLSAEPGRIRVRRGPIQRLLEEPVEVVDQVTLEEGIEFILQSPKNAQRAVVAPSDSASLAVAAKLPRALLTPDELEALRSRIAIADLPKNPNFDRFSDAQRIQQADLQRSRNEVRSSAIAGVVFIVIIAVFAALTR